MNITSQYSSPTAAVILTVHDQPFVGIAAHTDPEMAELLALSEAVTKSLEGYRLDSLIHTLTEAA